MTPREKKEAALRHDPHAKVQKSRRTKQNGETARYDRVANMAQEIALLPGGFGQFSKWFRATGLRDRRFQPLVDSFFQLPPRRQNAMELEDMAPLFGVSPAEVLGACVEIAYEHKRNVAKLIQSVAMPDVIKRNITEAKKVKGVKDREMFMQGTGLVPVGKGINITATAQAAAMTTEGDPSGLPDFDESTVKFSEIIRNATEIAPPALPEPIPEAVIVEGEDDD